MMLAVKKSFSEVSNVNTLYDDAVISIETILKRRYKMKSQDAKKAIQISPLKDIFNKNGEMAAHTSNETWAREIHNFWKQNNI